MFKKSFWKFFLPLPILIAIPTVAGLTSCGNDGKITITSSSFQPTLAHKGDAVILKANVSGRYAHIITWNFDEVTAQFGKKFSYSITTDKIFNDTLRIEINTTTAVTTNVTVSATNGKSTSNFSINLVAPQDSTYEEFYIDASLYNADEYFPDLVASKPTSLPSGVTDFVQYTNYLSDTWRTSNTNLLYLHMCMECFFSTVLSDDHSSVLDGEAWITFSDDASLTPLFNFNCDIETNYRATNNLGAGNSTMNTHCSNMMFGAPMADSMPFGTNDGVTRKDPGAQFILLPYYANNNYSLRNNTTVSSFWVSQGNDILQCEPSVRTSYSSDATYSSYFSNIANASLPTLTQWDIGAGTNLNVADKNTVYISNSPSLFTDYWDYLDAVNWNWYGSGYSVWQFDQWKENNKSELADFSMDLSQKFGGEALFANTASQQTEITLPVGDASPANHIRWETRPWLFIQGIYAGNQVMRNNNSLQSVTLTGQYCEYQTYPTLFALSSELSQSCPDSYEYGDISQNSFIREWTVTVQNS